VKKRLLHGCLTNISDIFAILYYYNLRGTFFNNLSLYFGNLRDANTFYEQETALLNKKIILEEETKWCQVTMLRIF